MTLVGYSMGARVIFECCMAMVKAGPSALGILHDGALPWHASVTLSQRKPCLAHEREWRVTRP